MPPHNLDGTPQFRLYVTLRTLRRHVKGLHEIHSFLRESKEAHQVYVYQLNSEVSAVQMYTFILGMRYDHPPYPELDVL